MDINNFLGKCEYFSGNSVNASCFNVNSGSAHVMLMYSSCDCLHQSLYLCLYLHCLLDFWNGGADVLTWGRPNDLGSEISRHQTCYMWSEIWGRGPRPDYLESDISSMSWSKPFS